MALVRKLCMLLLVVAAADAHEWKSDHRALWDSNVASQGRIQAQGRIQGQGGPAKRHAALPASWVPGSKLPLFHYPSDRRELKLPEDRLQYMERADTLVSAWGPDGTAQTPERGRQGGRGGKGARRRGQGDGRKLRHHHQRHEHSEVPAAAQVALASNTTVLRRRTVQRGSGVVPHLGATVPIGPDHAKTYHTLVSPGPSPGLGLRQQSAPANLAERRADRSYASVPLALSLPPCPTDRTVLAPKGQDYVIMDQITTRDGTPLDVVAGPRAGDPAPEGPHPVVGRLVGPRHAPRQSRLCRLTYTVMVRRCGPAPALASGVSPRCTAGTAWGSRCHYRCPRRDLQLRGRMWIQCGDDLTWSGRPPVCAERPGAAGAPRARAPTRRSCAVLPLPEHGVLSCRAQQDPDSNDPQRLAEGSECTLSCKEPLRLAQGPAQVTRCQGGQWNVTNWACVRDDAAELDPHGEISAVLSDAEADGQTGLGIAEDDGDLTSNSLTDPCSPNPCRSGGTCLRGPFDPHRRVRAICHCRPGTEGERCERVQCRGPCLHSGRCLLVRGKPTCFCRRGFAGSRCQAPTRTVRYPTAGVNANPNSSLTLNPSPSPSPSPSLSPPVPALETANG